MLCIPEEITRRIYGPSTTIPNRILRVFSLDHKEIKSRVARRAKYTSKHLPSHFKTRLNDVDGIIIGGGVVARPLQFQLGKFTNMNGIIEKQDPGWDVIDEDEMQGSYNWQRNDPLLPEVDTTTLCQIRRSEESHTNEL